MPFFGSNVILHSFRGASSPKLSERQPAERAAKVSLKGSVSKARETFRASH